MASLYKKSLQRFAEVTTIHGIHDLTFAKNKHIRLLWIMVLLLSVCLMIYMMIKSVLLFAESPTVYTVSIKTMDNFPPIRLMLHDFIDTTKAEAKGLNQDHICYLHGYFKEWKLNKTEANVSVAYMVAYNNTAGKEQCCISVRRYESQGLSPNQSYLEKLKHDIEDAAKGKGVINLIKELSYEPNTVVTLEAASGNTVPFMSMIVDEFGVSYLIGARREQTDFISNDFPMQSSALKAEINKSLVADDNFKIRRCPNQRFPLGTVTYASYFGAVMVGDTYDDKRRINVGEIVPPIKIKVKYTHRVNRPKSPCKVGGVSLAMCKEDCRKDISKVSGECSTDEGLSFFNRKSNHSGVFLNKYNAAEPNSSICRLKIKEAIKCIMTCIRPCEKWTYQVDKVQQNEINFDGFMGTFALESGWEASAIEESQIYTFEALLSNIGGLLGLFMGASLMSILQLAVYWFCGTCLEKAEDQEQVKTSSSGNN